MHFYGQSSSDILGAGWRSGRSDEILNVDAVFAHLENIPEKKKKHFVEKPLFGVSKPTKDH